MTGNPEKPAKTLEDKYACLIVALIPICMLATVCIFTFKPWVFDPCGNEFVQEIPSPSGEYKVLIYLMNCGATVDYETEISVVGNNYQLKDQSGNVYRVESAPFLYDLKVNWIDDQHVVIETNGKATPDYIRHEIGDVQILYVERTPEPTYLISTSTPTLTPTFTPTHISTLPSTPTPTDYIWPTHLPSRTPTPISTLASTPAPTR
jgi:hypothetical protein